MSKKILDNFDLRAKKPLDKRNVVTNLSDVILPYEGLITYQTSDTTFYKYINGAFIVLNLTPQNVIDKIANISYINVKDYGARGDGSDDIIAINNAIIACGTSKGLLFPDGTYCISQKIIFPNSISIVGAGTTTIIKPLAIMETLFHITADFIDVNGFNFVNDANKATSAIYFIAGGGDDYSKFTDNYFHGFDYGFNNNGGDGFIVSKNYFQDCKYAMYSSDDARNTVFSENYVLSGSGIYLRKTTIQPEGVRIVNNTFLGIPNTKESFPFGIKLDGGLGIVISGNIIDQYYANGIRFQIDTFSIRFVSIIGNWIGGSPDATSTPNGIDVTTISGIGSCEDIIIEGNVIATNKGYGLAVNSKCKNWRIINNSFYDNRTIDLDLEDSQLNFVSGNNFGSTVASYASLREISNITTSIIKNNSFNVGAVVMKSTASKWKDNFNVTDSGIVVASPSYPWVAYTPIVSAGTGTITTASATGRYVVIDKTVHFKLKIVITTLGTGAQSIIATLPLTAKTGEQYIGSGTETYGTGKALNASIFDTKVGLLDYNNTFVGANGSTYVVSGTYEIN